MSGFRFSSNIFGLRSRDEFAAMCRRAESHGYDTIFAADHLGHAAPFQAVVAAAAATERVRVGTLVINVPFWNPALLAREIATADILTGGRLEVGLGSGHMKWEFDEAGIGWESHAARAARLSATIGELARLFAGDGYEQQAELRQRLGFGPLLPVQHRGFGGHGPPLLVGGSGDRVLRIAAGTADIVGIGGLFQRQGEPPGVFRLCTAAEADERVRFARECAGDRAAAIAWHALTQAVVVTGDRRKAAGELAEQYRGTVTADEILVNPFLFVGTIEDMAEQVIRNRDRYGFTYYTVHEPYLDAFAPVIERVRALAG
ncbi:MAG TPA: TIGR03621 family F420-dependent LLM class oxidoreductase [Streptosporangiaceae bacterium]|nr:TIGR03621 family F420-dependent LLM class oxidoreductase [Streptosporangiaceae bacterium]